MAENLYHWPLYDIDSATLAKWRRAARKGLKTLPPNQRQAYGDAVERAVLAKQRAQLNGASPPEKRPSCASRTWYTTGAEIDAAIRRQHQSDLLAYPAKVRRERTPEAWKKLYEEAMKDRQAMG